MNKTDIAKIGSWNIKFRPMFGTVIKELAEKNKDVVLVLADSGRACRCDGFERCPEQFVDCGIAEQNMTGVAAGLARCGKHPVTFGFAPFASERCFEQIRVDVAYSGLNIVVVGSEGGIGMGTQGVTHYGWEDIGVMSSLPGMTVLCPADHISMISLLEWSLEGHGPVYLRLNGGVPDQIYQEDHRSVFHDRLSVVHSEGRDVNFLVSGPLLSKALEAGELLGKKGISAGVVDMFSIKPIDRETILRLSEKSRLLVTIEEHSIVNGLGSMTANIMAENGSRCRLVKLGLPDEYPHTVSPYQDMLRDYHLTAEDFAAEVEKVLNMREMAG